MAQLKGKFITLAGQVMALHQVARKEADNELFLAVGKHFDELDPEGWYSTKVFDVFMEKYARSSTLKDKALLILGRNIYPTIKTTVGIPEDLLKNPLEFLKYEGEGFLANHKGSDVKPRKYIKVEEGNVVVQAPAPGYNCKLYEGVFKGILEMCKIKTGKIEETKCIKKGDPTCEFHITW